MSLSCSTEIFWTSEATADQYRDENFAVARSEDRAEKDVPLNLWSVESRQNQFQGRTRKVIAH